jgi:nitric oxide synthase oxygenase domain/subunit
VFWKNVLEKCFGKMFWKNALEKCFGKMFWENVRYSYVANSSNSLPT